MATWTEKELELYRKMVCSESISASCEDCPRAETDIDNCYQELRTDAGL